MYKFEQINPDDEETIRNRTGFVHISMYASMIPTQFEIGCVGKTRFTLADPVISARREVIRASKFGKAKAEPAMRAECALMGHVSLGGKLCCYCGAEE
jgi:hypothetical protein